MPRWLAVVYDDGLILFFVSSCCIGRSIVWQIPFVNVLKMMADGGDAAAATSEGGASSSSSPSPATGGGKGSRRASIASPTSSGRKVQRDGDVAEVMDKLIGKKVLHIRGSIPANNRILMPGGKSHSLGLTGKYVAFNAILTPLRLLLMWLL